TQVHHIAYSNGIVLCYNGSLHDGIHAKNACMRLIDDWYRYNCTKDAWIIHNKRTVLHILDSQFVAASTLSNCTDLLCQASERVLVGIIERRHHQSDIGSDRDAQVDALFDDDLVVLCPGRIDRRELADALTNSFHHKWH